MKVIHIEDDFQENWEEQILHYLTQITYNKNDYKIKGVSSEMIERGESFTNKLTEEEKDFGIVGIVSYRDFDQSELEDILDKIFVNKDDLVGRKYEISINIGEGLFKDSLA